MYRNKRNQLIKSSKNKYFVEYFNNNKTNIKNIWSGIRKLITNKSKGCSVPSKLIIANAFTNFFTNVGTNLAQEILHSMIPHPLLWVTLKQITSLLNM